MKIRYWIRCTSDQLYWLARTLDDWPFLTTNIVTVEIDENLYNFINNLGEE